jgi:hypothetical protein
MRRTIGAALAVAIIAVPAAAAPRPPLPANHDLWLQVGRCEQPGKGYGGVNWSHQDLDTRAVWGSIQVRGMPTSRRATPTTPATQRGGSRWSRQTAYGTAPDGDGDAISGSRLTMRDNDVERLTRCKPWA